MAERIMDYRSIYKYDFGIKKVNYSGNQGLGCCPIHPDKNPSFSFNIETGQNKCFSCNWEGNAYTLAKKLNMENPRQYIVDTRIDSNNSITSKNKLIRPFKSQNKQVDEVRIIEKYKRLKKRYGNRVNLGDNYKDKYVGKDDNGEVVFIYPKGIKIHKKYWIKEASTDTSNQIFMVDEMSAFDRSKPLYIFEGEKDALISPLQGISFSCGATSIPKSTEVIYAFGLIIIIYDNDKAGEQGAKKVAEQIKSESPITIVKIAQWDSSLPEGYDVYDDYNKTSFEKVDEAVFNATIYELPVTQTENNIGDFIFMSPKDMMNAEYKPPEWYVEGILPKGFNSMIAGTTGSKKSLYAMQMAMCLANGEKDFCGGKIDRQYKIMYVDTEAGNQEFQKRFKDIVRHMDWKGDDHFRAISRRGRTADIWEQAHNAISRFEPDLIIIDCLYNSTSLDDFSKSSAMSKVTNALSDFKTKRGVDMLAVHHFTKGNHDVFTLDRISGASALQNWIEYCILMVRTNKDDMVLWRIGKARGVPHNENIYALYWNDFWFIEDGIVEDIAPFMIDKHAKNKYAQILEGITDGKFDRKDWINVFCQEFPSMSERTGDTWLKKCLEARMIKKVAKGIYEKHLRLINEENIDNR